MATSYIHTCYRIRDPQKSEDFYVNKLGMKKVGEMDLGSATNHFFAFEEDPSEPMLELTHNHDRTEPGASCANPSLTQGSVGPVSVVGGFEPRRSPSLIPRRQAEYSKYGKPSAHRRELFDTTLTGEL